MGEAIKVLAQRTPAAATQETLYTVPVSTTATCSTLVICNQNASTVKVRARIRVNGAANDNKQYLLYDLSILKNDTFALTIGMTLSAGDLVDIQSDTTLVSFTLFGVELT